MIKLEKDTLRHLKERKRDKWHYTSSRKDCEGFLVRVREVNRITRESISENRAGHARRAAADREAAEPRAHRKHICNEWLPAHLSNLLLCWFSHTLLMSSAGSSPNKPGHNTSHTAEPYDTYWNTNLNVWPHSIGLFCIMFIMLNVRCWCVRRDVASWLSLALTWLCEAGGELQSAHTRLLTRNTVKLGVCPSLFQSLSYITAQRHTAQLCWSLSSLSSLDTWVTGTWNKLSDEFVSNWAFISRFIDHLVQSFNSLIKSCCTEVSKPGTWWMCLKSRHYSVSDTFSYKWAKINREVQTVMRRKLMKNHNCCLKVLKHLTEVSTETHQGDKSLQLRQKSHQVSVSVSQWVSVSVSVSHYVPLCNSVCLWVCLSESQCVSVCLSVCLWVCLSELLFIFIFHFLDNTGIIILHIS